jgi:phytoene dehydrogenase-like protein
MMRYSLGQTAGIHKKEGRAVLLDELGEPIVNFFPHFVRRHCGQFAARFKDLGGKIILNNGVAKILLKDKKVTGVRLESGEELSADGVVATIHPKALLPLLEPEALRSSFRERILNLTETDGVIVVQISVDAEAHREMTHNIYRLHTDENGFITEGIFYQIRRGNVSGANLLSIITKSLYSDWREWEATKTGKRGRDYENKKLAIANELLKKADKVFGGLKDARIVDVFTPLTLRDYVDCPEGSCYGVLRSAGQLLKIASLNNIPLAGLCLAGQNAVAPGVLGTILGSFNAARQIAGAERLKQELKKVT